MSQQQPHQPKDVIAGLKSFKQFTDVDFQLDTTKFLLSPSSLEALKNLRVSYMINKVDSNALAFYDNPQGLMMSLLRGDIALSVIDHLIELDTTNKQDLEKANEQSNKSE